MTAKSLPGASFSSKRPVQRELDKVGSHPPPPLGHGHTSFTGLERKDRQTTVGNSALYVACGVGSGATGWTPYQPRDIQVLKPNLHQFL